MRHEYAKEHAEEVVVARLLKWLGRPGERLTRGVPDWTYTFERELWHVEVSSASLHFPALRRAYAQRLASDPASPTTPSTSDGSVTGVYFEPGFVIREDDLAAGVRDALAKKAHMRYGNEARTHLVIDASGERIAGMAAACRIAAACALPADYPGYAGVLVVFAIEDWRRPLLPLGRQSE